MKRFPNTKGETMHVTFILKDLTTEFYEGGRWSIGLLNLQPLEQYLYLATLAWRKELQISMKIGNDSFRDRVEFNSATRKGLHVVSGKVEPRKGYKLASFEVAL